MDVPAHIAEADVAKRHARMRAYSFATLVAGPRDEGAPGEIAIAAARKSLA